MGLLDNFERGLERAVNGAFAKTFRSGVQPLELTNALRRELDTKAAVVSRDRILVPNELLVRLAPMDYEKMAAIGSSLIDELTQLTQRHATAQGYHFAGPVSIRLREDDSLSIGIMAVDSRNVRGEEVSWRPVVDIDGQRHVLRGQRTVIGRGSDADITIQDTGTSRRHVEILWDGDRAQVRDLGSTNGSKLNGEPFSKAPLLPDSTIQIGRTRIVFRVLPLSATPDPFSGPDVSGGRR
ncbi:MULTISPECIES: DUF3662 and FHA domain-containing protein [unclassified Frigoribacterium]|uniref:FhaA domain-containing protein n=1 Tax=unclassified Frigoribacterium TaxID=2627005 RepID=UPI000700889C|nr:MULTISPECIES: DUF3662 and FHA domain-containing protein [unclassified Frigoribacterium]KQO81513.1 phosphopeptide-binding protein [Frigoribacterium sp. Leaf263]KQR65824.1 phosphopeptide-binding protein [Frigoribacterium sp. Leaf172]